MKIIAFNNSSKLKLLVNFIGGVVTRCRSVSCSLIWVSLVPLQSQIPVANQKKKAWIKRLYDYTNCHLTNFKNNLLIPHSLYVFKTLRRLAQNREAARKSRLRKKVGFLLCNLILVAKFYFSSVLLHETNSVVMFRKILEYCKLILFSYTL